MRAIRVSAFGGPDVLKFFTDIPIPKINENQVLLKVFSAGVNPVDTYIRTGTYARRPELPYIPGGDAAGIIADIGSNVNNVKKGQRVYTVFAENTYAEYAVCDAQTVFPLADKLSFHQGAALGVPYFTAYRALIIKGHIKAGETVLVHGASGGVGIAAVQIAKSHGMTVIGTVGTEEGKQIVKGAGAHHVFSHRDPNYISEIMEVTNGKGVDVIIEMLANVNLAKDSELLARNGRAMIVGNRGSIEIDPRKIMPKEASIIGVSLFAATPADFKEISSAIASGVEDGWVKPIIDKEYALENSAQAHHDIINSSGAKGKLVLKIAS